MWSKAASPCAISLSEKEAEAERELLRQAANLEPQNEGLKLTAGSKPADKVSQATVTQQPRHDLQDHQGRCDSVRGSFQMKLNLI